MHTRSASAYFDMSVELPDSSALIKTKDVLQGLKDVGNRLILLPGY